MTVLVRASHWHREVMGLNPIEVLNFSCLFVNLIAKIAFIQCHVTARIIASVKFLLYTFRSLPDVIILHITQFLAPKDLGNMLRVDRYFRQLFSAPHFWRGITVIVCLSKTERKSKQIDPWVLQAIKSRGITELVIQNSKCGKENDVIEVILQSLGSQLEGISFAFTGPSIFPILRKAAVAGNWKLKRIDFGDIHWMTSYEQFAGVLQQLLGLEEIILGYNLDGVRPSRRSSFSLGERTFELKV